MKILTISIAAYNVDKFIENTLLSLIVEIPLIDMLEIIVEDDGSRDNTYQIAMKYQSIYPNIIYVNHCNNGGYGATINRSIQLATGKYFKQLDGDDWFDTNNLKDFLLFLNKTDADFVISPYYKCYKGKQKELINHFPELTIKDYNIGKINKRVNLAMHELTVKTSLLKDNAISISENCFYTDNEYTFLPLLKARTVSKFEKAIYCYRLGRDGQSISLDGVKKHYKDSIVVANKLYAESNKFKNKLVNDLIEYKLELVTDTVYTYYLVIQTEDARKELVLFDAKVKNVYPTIYKISNNVKKIALLRKSKFILYNFIGQKKIREWQQKF